jgi:hypothetical protein
MLAVVFGSSTIVRPLVLITTKGRFDEVNDCEKVKTGYKPRRIRNNIFEFEGI